MCKWGTTTKVRVKVPADLSSTGKERRAIKPIDSCIAPIVKALQKAGIDTRSSCCGHKKREGHITLQDGRAILVLDKRTTKAYIRRYRSGEGIKDFICSEIR